MKRIWSSLIISQGITTHYWVIIHQWYYNTCTESKASIMKYTWENIGLPEKNLKKQLLDCSSRNVDAVLLHPDFMAGSMFQFSHYLYHIVTWQYSKFINSAHYTLWLHRDLYYKCINGQNSRKSCPHCVIALSISLTTAYLTTIVKSMLTLLCVRFSFYCIERFLDSGTIDLDHQLSPSLGKTSGEVRILWDMHLLQCWIVQ